MNRFATTLAAASFALATTFAQAQMTPGGHGMGPMHDGMKAAHEACKDKPDRRACMMEQMCAKAPDPAQCHARAKERSQHMQQRAEKRQMMHEACSGRRGDDLANCIKSQRQKYRAERLEQRQKAHEACNGKRGDELGKCLGEQRQKFGPRGPHLRG